MSCMLGMEVIARPLSSHLASQKATPDLPVQLLPNLVLSKGYGLRGKKKKKLLLLKVFMPTRILLAAEGLVVIRMT